MCCPARSPPNGAVEWNINQIGDWRFPAAFPFKSGQILLSHRSHRSRRRGQWLSARSIGPGILHSVHFHGSMIQRLFYKLSIHKDCEEATGSIWRTGRFPGESVSVVHEANGSVQAGWREPAPLSGNLSTAVDPHLASLLWSHCRRVRFRPRWQGCTSLNSLGCNSQVLRW